MNLHTQDPVIGSIAVDKSSRYYTPCPNVLVFVYNDGRPKHVNILNNADRALFRKLSQAREYNTAAKRKSDQSNGPNAEIAVD